MEDPEEIFAEWKNVREVSQLLPDFCAYMNNNIEESLEIISYRSRFLHVILPDSCFAIHIFIYLVEKIFCTAKPWPQNSVKNL